jgi:hypothetical protein
MNDQRGRLILAKIDEILNWEKETDQQKDARFLELGRYLCEVRACQYWKLEQLRSFDDFLDKRFPDSKRKAFYLMSIHESLPHTASGELSDIGWAKAAELSRVARRDREAFAPEEWLSKAKALPLREFQKQVEHHLSGNEPVEILKFKLYRSQVTIVDQALHMADLMGGGHRSRGLCLEMICADFLGEVGVETENPDLLLFAVRRLASFLNETQIEQLLGGFTKPNGVGS